MAAKTGIEWTATRNEDGTVTPGATWSPNRARVRQDAVEIATSKGYTSLLPILKPGKIGPHCERVSAECDHCYSETNNGRCLPANGTGLPFDRRARNLVESFVDEKILLQPLSWKAPRKIFVDSQTDLFGDWNTDEQIATVFAVMGLASRHTFQVLTKRYERMQELCSSERFRNLVYAEMLRLFHLSKGDLRYSWPLRNVWFGVSAGDSIAARKRVPDLLRTPAAVRFISYEPAIGPLEVERWLYTTDAEGMVSLRSEMGMPTIDWVIAGGESGSGARPAHPNWFRNVRDQCHAAGVAFFFKQWGEYGAVTYDDRHGAIPVARKTCWTCWVGLDGSVSDRARDWDWPMTRVGKKPAGRMLDGRTWEEMPK